MTMQMVGGVHRRVAVEIVSKTQTSTNDYAEIEESRIDMRPWKSLSYTITVADETVNYKVFGANKADFSDEVEVQAEEAVTAGSVDDYTVAQAPFGYYRVKIKSAASGTHGNATVNGIAKG